MFLIKDKYYKNRKDKQLNIHKVIHVYTLSTSLSHLTIPILWKEATLNTFDKNMYWHNNISHNKLFIS